MNRFETIQEELDWYKKGLILAGEVATKARRVTGGIDISIGSHIPPANLKNAGVLTEELEDALNEYDSFIIDDAMKRS